MNNILVTGGSGMIGGALRDLMPEATFIDSKMYDLRNQLDVGYLFINTKPDYVIHLAAKVGGVKANVENLGSFYYDNMMINTNVLDAARKYKTKKVLSFLSTCIYPDEVVYPLTEEQIHDGPPHSSNYAYAYAKRMLDVQSQAYRAQYGCNFITVVPNNLFGEYDNFDLENSHLIPAIIRKVYEAKEENKDVVLWGDGKPLREFTYSKDLAKIVVSLLDQYNEREPINVGNTKEFSVKKVAEMIANIMKFDGNIVWDITQPKGQHRKPSDNSKLLKTGWKPKDYTPFKKALKNTCKWFIENYPNVRGVK
jgi:GDP-L-fucose synthase